MKPRPAHLALLSVGPLLAGCTPGSAPRDTSAPYELTILERRSCELPSRPGAPERSALGIRVRLISRSELGVAANYYYASVLAGDGSRYLAELPGCSPVLSGAPLRSGESAEGFLNFPLPPDRSPAQLVYLPPIGTMPENVRARQIQLTTTTLPNEPNAP